MADRVVRTAGHAGLVAFVVIAALLSSRNLLVVATCVVVGLLTVACLYLRDPLGWTLLLGCAVVVAVIEVLCAGDPGNLGWFGVCVAVGWCALRGGSVQGLVLSGAVVVTLAAHWALVDGQDDWGPWIAGTVFTVIVCVMARRQSDLVDQLREAQAGLADRARAEERNRIAREFHDVIGHSLTVSLLHVSSARLAVDEDPAAAAAALEEAERLGRQSLSEVRSTVGMLHGDSVSAPMPGARQIGDLVEAMRRAGTAVELEVIGSLDAMTATNGLAAYRIVQEALTNAARHAPGASACVRVEAGPPTILTVDSAGPPTSPRPGALGVVSMRERAEALGGELDAGPWDNGWRVYAVIPS